MSEPTLESIEDYDTLKGEKKKVVLAVVFASLLIGVIYVVVASFFTPDEVISQDMKFKAIPMR